jgi:hypothetical protein
LKVEGIGMSPVYSHFNMHKWNDHGKR